MKNENIIPPTARECPYFGKFIDNPAFKMPKVCMNETNFSNICMLKKCCCYRSYLLEKKFRRSSRRCSDGIVNPYGEPVETAGSFRVFRQ